MVLLNWADVACEMPDHFAGRGARGAGRGARGAGRRGLIH